MALTLQPGGLPLGVNLGEAGAVVTNYGAGTVSYSDTGSPFVAEGTIAAAASATLYGTQFFVSAVGAVLGIAPLPVTITDSAVAVSPTTWNARFRAKLAASPSALVRIGIVADSIGQGAYASDLDQRSWVGLTRTTLQAAYGDGGTGFKGPGHTDDWLSKQSVAWAPRAAWLTAGNLLSMSGRGTGVVTAGSTSVTSVSDASWTNGQAIAGPGIPGGTTVASGGGTATLTLSAAVAAGVPTAAVNLSSWNEYASNDAGPGLVKYKTTVVGDRVTQVIRGTAGTIYTIPNAGGNANWRWRVDGGAWNDVTDSGSFNIRSTPMGTLSSGTHTIDVENNGDGVKTFYFAGIEAHNGSGVVVHNLSRFGALIDNFAEPGSTMKADQWNGGRLFPVDLAVVALGLNDATGATTTAALVTSLLKILNEIRQGGTQDGTTDLLVVINHVGTFDNATPKWGDMAAAMSRVAVAYGAGLLNLWADGRASWNYWNAAGYWGNGAVGTGAAGTNNVHLSDAGHQHIRDLVVPMLLGPS